MLDSMDREDRLRLMKFVCSFAWADLEIQKAERTFIKKTMKKLELDAEERAMVEEWMTVPPSADELDPAEIPPEHRQLFIDFAMATVAADGQVDEDEQFNLEIFQALLG